MTARLDGVTRIPLLLAIGLLACFTAGPWQATADAQCLTCGSRDACECPVPDPRLETSPGTSLFWHDHCGGGYEYCFRRFYCNDACRPTWYASAEFVPLYRAVSNSTPMQSLGPAEIQEFDEVTTGDPPVTELVPVGAPVPDIVLGTGDFDADFDPGIKVVLGRAIGDWYRLEASWKGSYSWSDSVTVRDAASSLWSPFSNFGNPDELEGEDYTPEGFVGLDLNSEATIGFSSTLNDVELNVRRRLRIKRMGALKERRYAMGEASFLVGLRYMNIDERFHYATESAVAATTLDIDTDNDMFGVQLGYLAQILVQDRGWIDVDIKGAVLFNEAGQSTAFYNDLDPVTNVAFGADEQRTAFLGDLSVTYNYQIAPSFTFRAGYNGMFLTGVALAVDNFNSDLDQLENGPAQVVHDGDVIYHGPQIGFVWTR
jgi:hypothetical protein